jgi:hypothetical protein
MLPIIGFFFYMGILTIIRGARDYKDLTLVNGTINNYRNVIHLEPRNRYGRIEKVNVLAFNVAGYDNEFGITEKDKIYLKVKGILANSDSVKIQMYYDSKGQRIEENISLHIFELKLND